MKASSLLWVLLITAPYTLAGDMTPAQAFDLGKAFGQSPHGASAVKGSISGANAATNVPHHDTVNANSAYYGGGDGDPRTPGSNRVAVCATTTYADPRSQVECDAINDIAKNRSTRPPLTVTPHDPILVKGKTVKADPASVAGAFGGAYGACSTATVTRPAVYEEEICNEYKTLGEEVCQKILTVTVTVNETCTPGTWYPVGSGLFTLIHAYCEPDRSDGMLQLRFTPNELHGICQYGYATVPKAPFYINNGQNFWIEWICDEYSCYLNKHNLLTTAINHWKGACTVPIDIGYGVGSQGCSGGTCTYIFTYQDYRWGHVRESSATNPFSEPKRIVTEEDKWDNQCTLMEARAE